MDQLEAISILGTKDVSPFTNIKTPEGNTISGWMVRSRSSKLGSLIITDLNGIKKPEYQLCRSFPKISYLDKDIDYEIKSLHALEKRDGTCAILYPLFDHPNESIIEIVPKTREMAVMDEGFQKLLKDVPETEKLKEMTRSLKSTICAELFGEGNIHEIPYSIWGKNLSLEGIGILNWNRMYPWDEAKELFDCWKIPTPFDHLEFTNLGNGKWLAKTTDAFLSWYKPYLGQWQWGWTHEGSLIEIYNLLQNELYEDILKNAERRVVIEGSVWHYQLGDADSMLKNKAISIKEVHILRAGVIQPIPIRHALLRAKDEMGEEEFKNFENILPLVKANLMEHFDADKVNKSEARIKSLWGNILNPQALIDLSALIPYVEEVNALVGKDASITDKMRKFATLHPDLRKWANKMYSAFSKS